jgi:very-short-patch-repair endonuclease
MAAVAPGAYADLTDLCAEDAHRVRAAAVLERLGDVVASHATALALWQLPTTADQLTMVHVTRTASRAGRPKSRRWYRMHPGPVPADRTAERGGIPVTDPAQTLLDCARFLGLDWGVVAADAAIRRDLVDPVDLEVTAAQARGVTGAARARALPEHVSPLAESPGESLLRLRLRRMGVAVREQVVLVEVEGVPRVDFLVGDRLVIEFDGRAKYARGGDVEAAMWSEKCRHDRIVEAGYEVLRVTWADLWDEAALRERVRAALRRASLRHPRA